MKQFIVLMAALPLLLVFMMQFAADQQYAAAVAAVDDAVYAAKEMAKQAGCFTEEIRSWLRREIARKIKGLVPADIIIGSGTDTEPVYRTGLIHYQVSVPLRGLLAGRSLLGVRAQDSYYVIDSYTPSELLER